jgi:hypothetical protein
MSGIDEILAGYNGLRAAQEAFNAEALITGALARLAT